MKILFLEIETTSPWGLAAPGPGHLAAFIRPHGHQAALLRIPQSLAADHILSGVMAERPDILGLSLTTRQWPRALEVARRLKEHLDLPIIAGGLQATFDADRVLGSGAFDFACIGEGEEALLELLDTLAAGADPGKAAIRNIRCRGAPPPPLRPPLGLDQLPFVARDLLDERHGVLHLSTQRGCPFPCTFCAAGSLRALYPGQRYLRRRSAANVLAEIAHLRETGPLNYLVFLDDTFTLNPPWVEAFCRAYGREFAIGFSINARVETVTPHMLGQLADAGCRHVIYGVESGSPRLRREVLGRPLEDRSILDAFAWTRQAGMLVTANYLLGVPGETPAEIEQTLALHQRLAPDDFGWFVFRPYPGTPLFELCRERGYLPPDPAQPVAEDESILRLPTLGRDEIAAGCRRFAELRDELYRRRYSGNCI
jgi:anaerobic magnesium-protoporphyrin IX monomethyl ester cyclase